MLQADDTSDVATFFNYRCVTAVVYSDGITRYDGKDTVAVIGNATMTSETWGPHTFIITLPNKTSPNQPNGYRYDEMEIKFGVASCFSYCDVVKLEYFTKEVE